MVFLGERIKLARLRRKYTLEQVSERANISKECLLDLESGESTINIGIYANVLYVLGLSKDLSEMANDDILGRKLQDIELLNNNIVS